MGEILSKLPINWGLIKNPLNWVIIVLMLLIAGIAFDVIARGISATEKGPA